MNRSASFSLWFLALPIASLTDETPAEMLYWTDLGIESSDYATPRIRRIESDGVQINDLVTTNRAPNSIVFDPVGVKVYWIDGNTTRATIRSSNPDGSQAENVIEFNDQWPRPTGIAVDPSRKLYWCQDGPMNNKIMRSNLDGSDHEVLATDLPSRPTAIALDTVRSKAYWAEFGGRIRRTNLNGGDVEDVLSDPFFFIIRDLDVVPETGQVFWAASQTGIYRMNSDGSGVQETIDDDACPDVRGLTVVPADNSLYWACGDEFYNGPSRIRKAQLDGSNVTDLIAHPNVSNHSFNDVTVAPTIGMFFWTSNTTSPTVGKVHSTELLLAREETLIDSGLEGPRGIAFDPQAGKMYWADRRSTSLAGVGRVWRSNLDGTSKELLITEETGSPSSIALDTDSQKMYWTDTVADSIFRANFDGSEQELILSFKHEIPVGLALDLTAAKMYLTFRGIGLSPSAIRRSNLDGTAIEDLVLAPDLITDYLGQIVLDLPHGKMYWASLYVIQRADLDGQNVEIVEFSPPVDSSYHVVGLFVDSPHQKLYWTEDGVGSSISRLRRANLDGSNAETVFTGGLHLPFGIALNPSPYITISEPPNRAIDARQPHGTNDPTMTFGWNTVDLTFSAALQNLAPENLVVVEAGGDGFTPNITSVTPLDETRVRINLDHPIEPGAWTCIRHIQSGTKSCLGFLPGDVSADGISSPIDILGLIDGLNGVANPPRALWQLDIDRSGIAGPSDILREIDLLNGAGAFEPWLSRTLPELP